MAPDLLPVVQMKSFEGFFNSLMTGETGLVVVNGFGAKFRQSELQSGDPLRPGQRAGGIRRRMAPARRVDQPCLSSSQGGGRVSGNPEGISPSDITVASLQRPRPVCDTPVPHWVESRLSGTWRDGQDISGHQMMPNTMLFQARGTLITVNLFADRQAGEIGIGGNARSRSRRRLASEPWPQQACSSSQAARSVGPLKSSSASARCSNCSSGRA